MRGPLIVGQALLGSQSCSGLLLMCHAVIVGPSILGPAFNERANNCTPIKGICGPNIIGSSNPCTSL